MRDYAQVRARFWMRGTGKALPAMGKLVAMHLMTSPHSNMLGLYYIPIPTLAHECGLDLEGASEGLRRCIEGGFAKYDEDTSCVWVVNMAREQLLGDEEKLDPKDRRVRGVENLLKTLEDNPFYGDFVSHYNDSLSIGQYEPPAPKDHKSRGSKAPSKPLRSPNQGASKPEIRDQRSEIREEAGEGPRPFSADRVQVIFRGAYLDAKKSDPTMSGTNLGGFYERILSTAAAQGREPEELYRTVLGVWLKIKLNPRELRSPYACFVQAWSELTDASAADSDDETGTGQLPTLADLEAKHADLRREIVRYQSPKEFSLEEQKRVEWEIDQVEKQIAALQPRKAWAR